MNLPFQPELSGNALLTGGLLVGVIAAFWSKLKAIAWRLCTLLIVEAEYQQRASGPIILWLAAHGRRMPGGMRWFVGETYYLRPKRRRWPVMFETLATNTAMYLGGKKPIWVKYHTLNNNVSAQDFNPNRVVVRFIRGMFDPEKLGFEAMENYGHVKEFGTEGNRYNVQVFTGRGFDRDAYGQDTGTAPSAKPMPGSAIETDDSTGRPVGYKREDLGQPIETVPFVGLYYPPEISVALKEVEHWLKSEKWYREKGIPWRRSFLLCGRPGNGKSRLIRAMGQHLNLPVYLFDLATMSNKELDNFWNLALANSPCMAVFEDLDGIFQGRVNMLGEKSTLSFDKFLQCLSGVASSDGVFVAITTNRPELLDEAIGKADDSGRSTRPGRVDRVLELGNPDDLCRRQILDFILEGSGVPCSAIARMADDLKGCSAAQISEHASRLALELYWIQANERIQEELPTHADRRGNLRVAG